MVDLNNPEEILREFVKLDKRINCKTCKELSCSMACSTYARDILVESLCKIAEKSIPTAHTKDTYILWKVGSRLSLEIKHIENQKSRTYLQEQRRALSINTCKRIIEKLDKINPLGIK